MKSVQTIQKIAKENIDENNKNCINDNILHENACNNAKNCNKSAKNICKCKSVNDAKRAQIQAYVKTLFTIYPSLPNIIKVIDNIVLSRASSIVPVRSVYTGVNSTISEIEKVIDMSDRKMKLLSIVGLAREILAVLSVRDYEIVDLKFFKQMKVSSIASRLEIDERSVFRRINKAIDNCVAFCQASKFDQIFFENQFKGEGWIKEIFGKCMSEIKANNQRSQRNMK